MCQDEELVAAGLEQSVGFAVSQAKLLSGSGENFAAGPGHPNICIRIHSNTILEHMKTQESRVFKMNPRVHNVEGVNVFVCAAGPW
jgi:hypothetical protein